MYNNLKRFYYPQVCKLNQHLLLPVELIRHIFALRLNINEQIVLFNGQGQQYIADIIVLERKKVVVEIVDIKHSVAPTLEITLGLCIIANDKMDFAIQKAVELGVSKIIPLISERSQVLSNVKISSKLNHWQSIVYSSCEQCYQDYAPIVNTPIKLTELITSCEYDYKTWLSLKNNHRVGTIHDKTRILLVVGPEGGFNLEEEHLMSENSFIPLNLGKLVLRSETAVCAGLSVINYKLGNYSG